MRTLLGTPEEPQPGWTWDDYRREQARLLADAWRAFKRAGRLGSRRR